MSLLLACLFSRAQVDVLSVEVSYWFNTLEDTQVPASMNLRFQSGTTTNKLELQLIGPVVSEARKVQGRLKEPLEFSQTEEELTIRFDGGLQPDEVHEVFIKFELTHDSSIYRHSWQRGNGFMAFNPLQIQADAPPMPSAGQFFPAIAGDEFQLKINLSVPAVHATKAPGELQFITDNQDGSVSHFWKADLMSADNFFLLIGEAEPDVQLKPGEVVSSLEEEQIEELEFSKPDPLAEKASQIRPLVADVVEYFDLGPLMEWTDSLYVYIDSLSQLPQPDFYIKQADIGNISERQYRLIKQMFISFSEDDTHTNYYISRLGEPWFMEVLASRYDNFQELSIEDRQTTLWYLFGLYTSQNEFVAAANQKILDTAFYEPLIESMALPSLKLSYRYVASEGNLQVIVRQDTSKAPAYSIPVKAILIQGNDSSRFVSFVHGALDTIKLPSPGTPNYAHLDFGVYFPGRVIQDKPENYWLYLLSNARHPSQKRLALIHLFQTRNPNLRSTVLGIAMDSDDPEMRMEALQRSDDLNAAAQEKLEATLRRLSTKDPVAEIRQQANALVSKYYGSK